VNKRQAPINDRRVFIRSIIASYPPTVDIGSVLNGKRETCHTFIMN